MEKNIKLMIIAITLSFSAFGQTKLVEVRQKTYKSSTDQKISGETGFLEVPENRSNPESRTIRLKYIRLKSIAEIPEKPLVFLEGGGGGSTWQAESPDDLTDWIPLLEVGDLIFLDRRGYKDDQLTYIWMHDFPRDFFLSEETANLHYQKMVKESLTTFEERGVDVKGYNIEDHAKDVDQLMTFLGVEKYSLFGFSFGSHISMTVMKLFPERIEKAILAGSDAPDQAFNFPKYLDDQVTKLSEMAKADTEINVSIPDMSSLLTRVMKKLDVSPAIVRVKNPVTRKKIDLEIGSFGLALVLRLDIDDSNDIPVLPRLLYSIDQGNLDMLTWFVQKRLVLGLAVPGNGINQQLASGASENRWATIQQQAEESIFGNVVNFPFSAAKDHWVTNTFSFDQNTPLQSDIPTLFITGGLDCRTPVAQVLETMKGFSNATHIEVENAGHEQAMWERETFDEIIPRFLLNRKIQKSKTYRRNIEFIPLDGKSKKHPSIR